MNNLDKLFDLLRSQEFADALRFLQSATLDGTQAKVWKSDAQKVEKFIRDIAAHVLGEGAKAFDALKQGDPVGAQIVIAGLLPFLGEAEAVLRAYGKRSESLGKFQFPRDLFGSKYRDPFKPERKLAEAFRLKWLQ